MIKLMNDTLLQINYYLHQILYNFYFYQKQYQIYTHILVQIQKRHTLMEKDNDIILSMSQTIQDLSFSISQISLKNQSLQEQIHTKIRKCPNQHPLRYLTADQKSNRKFIVCDICDNKPKSMSNVFWHCRRCDYDQCRQCGGYWKEACAYGHPLKLINYTINTITCDICFKNHLNSGWHCQCDFDMCQNCHDKERQQQ